SSRQSASPSRIPAIGRGCSGSPACQARNASLNRPASHQLCRMNSPAAASAASRAIRNRGRWPASSPRSSVATLESISAIDWLVFPLVAVEFQPHGVDDAEGEGQQHTENPGEVPHDRLLSTGYGCSRGYAAL